jgi:hypothetical protein
MSNMIGKDQENERDHSGTKGPTKLWQIFYVAKATSLFSYQNIQEDKQD